jgi:L-ascorbate metabolism protein UlaG (beta-lactamase superfamily)
MTKITWLGHATFELEFESGEVLLLDPWIEGNPAYPSSYKIDRVDAIAITHGHSDHVGGVMPLAKEFSPKIIAIVEVADFFDGKGLANTIGINKGGTVDLGFVKLTMTHALHSSSLQDGDKTLYGGEAAGFILTFKDGRKAYFAGDTAVFSEMAIYADLYQPELALLPIGDHYTMGPHEAAYAARLLKVKQVIPMHYGTFPALKGTPEELAAMLDKDGIKVWALEKGVSVHW